jgi:hypothetical protein
MKPGTELLLLQAERLANDIRPLFAGRPPAVLGVGPAELVAGHIAGAYPDLRAKARAEFINAVDGMVAEVEKAIFPDGLPAVWRR